LASAASSQILRREHEAALFNRFTGMVLYPLIYRWDTLKHAHASGSALESEFSISVSDRRISPRKKFDRNVTLSLNGNPLGHCIIKDISQGGAMLLFAHGSWMPSEFEITDLISRENHRVTRIWTRDQLMGVRFSAQHNEQNCATSIPG